MDLNHAIRLMVKRKWIIILGLILGTALAGLSLYKISLTDTPHLKPRSYTNYETSLGLLLDQAGFGAGRIDGSLPQLAALAQTYPALIMSQVVQTEVKNRLGSVDGTVIASSAEDRPIINIKVEGSDPDHLKKLASTTADVFVSYIRSEQKINKIPRASRVLIRKLGPPSEPVPLKSRQGEVTILIFLSTLAASVALAFILENLQQGALALKQKKFITELAAPSPHQEKHAEQQEKERLKIG